MAVLLIQTTTFGTSGRRALGTLLIVALAVVGCTRTAPQAASREEAAAVRPNTELPEPRASGRSAVAAVLDLTRNLVWFEDAAGEPTHAPQEESEIERLIPQHVTTRGSLEERYRGAALEERRRRMSEPTRVLLCTYENACLSIVHRLRGAPGDPRGFPGEEDVKEEGGVLPYTLPSDRNMSPRP